MSSISFLVSGHQFISSGSLPPLEAEGRKVILTGTIQELYRHYRCHHPPWLCQSAASAGVAALRLSFRIYPKSFFSLPNALGLFFERL